MYPLRGVTGGGYAWSENCACRQRSGCGKSAELRLTHDASWRGLARTVGQTLELGEPCVMNGIAQFTRR
jgi:hypothetical protein